MNNRQDQGRNRQGQGRGQYGASVEGGSFWRSGDGRDQNTSFRGRGPKGYERSDERLKEMICEKLTDDEAIDASEVSVEVSNREVTLTGTVSDRQSKYQIEELVEQCGGVQEIHNQLRVSRDTQGTGSGTEANPSGRAGKRSGQTTGQTTGQSGRSGI